MCKNLPNNYFLHLNQVGTDGKNSVHCHTDLKTCCNETQGPDRGDWYFPNRKRLPHNGDDVDIYQFRHDKQVDLRHRNNNDTYGIYNCTIETNAVKDDKGREMVYVGLYPEEEDGGECTHMCM